MKAIIKSLVVQNFWSETAAISGFTIGNTIALGAVSAFLYCQLGAGFWVVAGACAIVLMLSVPVTIYLLNSKWHVAYFDSPANIVSGFAICVVFGAFMFLIVPVLSVHVIGGHLIKNERQNSGGREAAFSIASTVNHYAKSALAAYYCHLPQP
jgi:hypothetical protein